MLWLLYALVALAVAVLALAALGFGMISMGAWLRARDGRRKRVWTTLAVIVGIALFTTALLAPGLFLVVGLIISLVVGPLALAIDREAKGELP